ncbi:MAG: hypothetical protein IKC97_01575 [Clostridia bacterium]|nr:hypothetical protein [Clostridia bacterium]
MKKGTGYYLKSYLKNNVAVLFFELVIIVLLALICTVLLGGQPVWLGPVLALCAYLLAELRFMMAYVATSARKQAEADRIANEVTDEQTTEAGDEDEKLEAEESVIVVPAIEESVTEEPVIEDPVTEEPVIEDPVTEEPVAEETVIEEPVTEEPVTEEPVTEEPVIEEPVIEEPAIEEPVIEEPVIEEPMVEQDEMGFLEVEEIKTQESIIEEEIIESDMAEPALDEEDKFDDGDEFDDDFDLPIRSELDLGDE